MFVEHQSTSGAKISPAPVLHKSNIALLSQYGNYGYYSISTIARRIITRGTLKLRRIGPDSLRIILHRITLITKISAPFAWVYLIRSITMIFGSLRTTDFTYGKR
jgi:hypothetical protein